jgi:hypothetical protein
MPSDLRVTVPAAAAVDAPVVVLVHGTGGTVADLGDPSNQVPTSFNWERVPEGTIRDRGWHAYPNVGWWSIGTDPKVPVDGWEPFLNGRGLPTVNYSQDAPRGPLADSAVELRALLADLVAGTGPFAQLGQRRIVLLGHSRGGVLIRQVLVDLARARSPILARISTCITLHAPNQGSNIANVAIALDTVAVSVQTQINALPIDPVVKAAIFGQLSAIAGFVHDEASAPAYRDYAVGARVLADIANAEPVPGIEYFTFGGTRPVLFNVRGWAFTLDSALPQWHDPPFHWHTGYQTLIAIPPPLPLLEATPGLGDVLVAAPLSRLPFGIHRDNPLNHAEALWDEALKIQVAAIIDRAPLAPTLVVECVTPDNDDLDRAIDALGGPAPLGGIWRLSLEDALTLADRGSRFFVRRPDGRLVQLQRVRRRSGRRYFRAPAGAGVRLGDLPRC